MIKPRGKVIRDPVHVLIAIAPEDSFLLRLIGTPEFQRLRRIRQLGVSNVTYPGAEHTRFSHSLGVLNFATRILHRLRERYSGDSTLTDLLDTHSKTVKAAALLHDTGHGPFSHMIERTFKSAAEHEARTGEVITSADSSVPAILQESGIPPNDVRAIIAGNFPFRFLQDIVSSQLDADRMDYLLRDALMTGVEYGRYDPEWLIHSLCLGVEPDRNVPIEPRNLRLCLDSARGLHAAEQLIVARMHMSFQVYYHRVTRGWEAHLLCLFQLASDLAAANLLPPATPEIIASFFKKSGQLSHPEFLRFDEACMVAAFHAWAEHSGTNAEEKMLSELARAFLCRSKKYHAQEFPENPVERSLKLMRKLDAAGAREGRDYYHDEARFQGYKDFGRSLAKDPESNEETIFSEAIFLADGDPAHRAKPVEQEERAMITPSLTSSRRSIPLNRVFVHETFKDRL